MRTSNELTEIRKKRARGDPLTEEDRAKEREYFRRYTRQKKSVHLKQNRIEEWTALAERQGISLSAWIQEQVEKGIRGNDEATKDLRDENQRLRDEMTALRGTCGQLRRECQPATAPGEHGKEPQRSHASRPPSLRWRVMTSEPKLGKAPSPQQEVWKSNDDIWRAWTAHVRKRGAKNTQRNLLSYNRVFMQSFDPLVTELERVDLEAFEKRISRKCAKLMNGAQPQCLAKLDVKKCPLLRQGVAYDSCSGYVPLEPSGVWSYICAINRLYEWLLEEERVPRNPMLGVMRDFASRHAQFFEERRRKPRRRHLKIEEVRLLVEQSPIHHAIGYLLMAKCYLRIHELLKLRLDADHFNIDEGWMDIPVDWELGGKRRGNRRIILDAEARRWMRKAIAHWEDHVARDHNGKPLTDVLMITVFGKPWGAAAQHYFNTALHADAVRIGLMTGNESREHRVNSHCFRSFATTVSRTAGCNLADLHILRGDLAGGTGLIDRYDDYLSRLPELYRKYAPVLGV